MQDYRAAGVLPYIRDREDNVVYLFSQERYGRDRGTWSDFGGSKEGSERPKDTALAELAEESKCIITIAKKSLTLLGHHKGYLLFTAPIPYRKYDLLFQSKKMDGFQYNEKAAIRFVKQSQLLATLANNSRLTRTTAGEWIAIRDITVKCIQNGYNLEKGIKA